MKVGDLVKHISPASATGYGIIIDVNHEWGTPPTTALSVQWCDAPPSMDHITWVLPILLELINEAG